MRNSFHVYPGGSKIRDREGIQSLGHIFQGGNAQSEALKHSNYNLAIKNGG